MLNLKKHHERLIEAILFGLMGWFIISRYSIFIEDMGTLSTTTRAKGLQVIFLYMDKLGGKPVFIVFFSLIVNSVPLFSSLSTAISPP